MSRVRDLNPQIVGLQPTALPDLVNPTLSGVEGLEPTPTDLESDMLPITPYPYLFPTKGNKDFLHLLNCGDNLIP